MKKRKVNVLKAEELIFRFNKKQFNHLCWNIRKMAEAIHKLQDRQMDHLQERLQEEGVKVF